MGPALSDCTAQDCVNGLCVLRHDGSLTCECYDSWTGPYCTYWCPCLDFECGNGTCVWDNTEEQTKCECDLGFTGKYCDQSSGCDFHSCHHGVCQINGEESTSCSCEQGWAGEFCDESALCSVLDCENGYCLWDEDNVALTKCQCDCGFYGIRCELISSTTTAAPTTTELPTTIPTTTTTELPSSTTTVPSTTTPNVPQSIIFQRRTIYDVDFNDQLFAAYENGFGDVNDEKGGDLWLGLAKMSQLTSTGNWHLKVMFTDFDNNSWWCEYSGDVFESSTTSNISICKTKRFAQKLQYWDVEKQ